jgi:hypothetical protein
MAAASGDVIKDRVTNERAYGKGFAITASDTVDFDSFAYGIMATVAGNVVVVWEDNTTSTLPVSPNVIYPWKCKRINSTSTTATGLFGFY